MGGAESPSDVLLSRALVDCCCCRFLWFTQSRTVSGRTEGIVDEQGQGHELLTVAFARPPRLGRCHARVFFRCRATEASKRNDLIQLGPLEKKAEMVSKANVRYQRCQRGWRPIVNNMARVNKNVLVLGY
jgi:hypothetical protein